MTEQTPGLPPAAPSPGLTPLEQRGREVLLRAGMSAEKIDARLGAPEGSVRPASDPTRASDGKFAAPPSVGSAPHTLDIKPAHALDAVNRLLAQGVDPERVRASALESGVDLAKVPELQLSEAQKAHNVDHGFGQVRSPADYPIDMRAGLGDHLRTMTPQDVKELHVEMSGAMASMHLPPALGSAVAERCLQIGARNANLSETELALRSRENLAVLSRKYGAELPARLADAKAALNLIPDQELRATIESLGNDVWLVSTLAAHGRNYLKWQAGYPK